MDERTFKTRDAKSSEDVLNFFDEYAPDWDARFGNRRSTVEFQKLRVEKFLQIAKLKSTDSVIELGVGTGPYLNTIAPLVKEVKCIDGSKRMLDVLENKYKHLSNIELLQIDVEKPLQNCAFNADIVYCFGLLEHIIDVNTFLKNCVKMLSAKGRMVFVCSNARSPWYKGMSKLWRAGRHCSTDKYYTDMQLNKLMVHFGFTPQEFIYWGYFPAGINDVLFNMLNIVGRMIDKTWLRRYAGGFAASYKLQKL